MAEAHPEAVAAAMATLDRFMAALNARDEAGLNESFNFPHVRIAGGKVRTFEKRGDYPLAYFLDRAGPDWARSAWESREVLQASADKVHLRVAFSRFRADGSRIGTFPSLWIVTCVDGHWGVQARSSFAL